MATKLGGVTLANPDAGTAGCETMYRGMGATMEMADGSIVYDYTGGQRLGFRLHWNGISSAALSTIASRAVLTSSQTFISPDGGTYTVLVLPNTLKFQSFEVGTSTPYFNVDLELEEVS